MFGLFKEKKSENFAVIAFASRIYFWAVENETRVKGQFLGYRKAIAAEDVTDKPDGLLHAAVAHCLQAVFNLYPMPQAMRLRNKTYDAMQVMGDVEVFEFFMDAKNDPDRHLLQNDPNNILYAIPVRLLEYWLGDNLSKAMVKIGDVELLSSLDMLFILEQLAPVSDFWKNNIQKNYTLIETSERIRDILVQKPPIR